MLSWKYFFTTQFELPNFRASLIKDSEILDHPEAINMMIDSPDSDLEEDDYVELEDTTRYLRQMVIVNPQNSKRFYARTKDEHLAVKKIQTTMVKIYDVALRRMTEEANLYPPLEVTAENATTLKEFLVVKHRGSFKRAKLEEAWLPGSPSIQVRLIDEGLSTPMPMAKCFKPLKHFFTEPAHVQCFHLSDVSFGESETESKATKLFETKCPQNMPIDLLVRGPEERMEDGQLSLPVEILLNDQLLDSPFAIGRPITKYMSPVLIQAGLANYPLNVSEVSYIEAEEAVQFPEENSDEEIDFLVGLEPVKKWPDPVFPPNWAVNDDLPFRAINVDDVGQIYGQPTSVRPLVIEMENLFSDIYGSFDENLCTAKTIKKDWIVGEDCVIYSDATESWNRGRVIQEVKGNFVVLFVDYGSVIGSITKSEVTYKHLRIPYHFGDVPILLVRLILEGVVSGVPDPNHHWNELVLEDLYKLVWLETSEDKSLTAQKTRDIQTFPIPAVLRVEKINPDSESSRVETTNVGDTLLQRFPRFVKPGLPNLTELESVHFAEALKIGPQEPNFHDPNILSSQLENPYPPPELPPQLDSGLLRPVKIGSTFSEYFYVHFEHQDLAGFTDNLAIAESEPPSNLNPGEEVACLFGDKWYRGYILEVTSNGRFRTASVFLVDRGDVKYGLDPFCFRQLPESMSQVPILAFRCYVHNFTNEKRQKLYDMYNSGNYKFFLDFKGQPDFDSIEGEIWVQIEDAKTLEPMLVLFETLGEEQNRDLEAEEQDQDPWEQDQDPWEQDQDPWEQSQDPEEQNQDPDDPTE